ncbi:MAG TPA: class I SAM-dependent methyltransferase [Methanotrichaceae archaeon]|nr:class I SAM-dependent methyltransferase [Methanotrichaceae archaeon]
MSRLSEILSCPRCGRSMSQKGSGFRCGCGFELEDCSGFYGLQDSKVDKGEYADYYTEGYFGSSLYDYSGYRLSRLVGLAGPRPGKRVLDLGCGPGEVAIRCARLGAEAFGIDISRDALRLSSRRASDAGVSLSLFEFDGQRAPFRDSVFDSIVLSDVVEHIDDATLDSLLAECQRMLQPDGRLVIHTSPTKSAIDLCRSVRTLTLGRLDLYSRLVNPDYEFLHIRYHSQDSLRRALVDRSLYPVIWGEFQYLAGSRLEGLLRAFGDKCSDQLWCVAFKDPEMAKTSRNDRPYLDLIDLPSELDLGRCSDLCLGDGFYGPEEDSFRWMGRSAGLFLNVPEGCSRLDLVLQAANAPLNVGLTLAGRPLPPVSLGEAGRHAVSVDVGPGVLPGPAELRLDVDRTFVPAELGPSEDRRVLGVAVLNVALYGGSK